MQPQALVGRPSIVKPVHSVAARLPVSGKLVKSLEFSVHTNKFSRNKPVLRVEASSGSGERQPWDIGRFVQTVLFFNSPPSVEKIVEGVLNRFNPVKEENKIPTDDVVLVVGATGGVGKRVVTELTKKGAKVRALVRNEAKARKLLGPDVDLITGDISQAKTLIPEDFVGVTRVINCCSVIVGPKEGDTPERAKYYQGIKFYDPEIKGDTPEAVEFIGVKNLLQVLQPHLPSKKGRVLFGIGENGLPIGPAWGPLDDVVMGGVSRSTFLINPTAGQGSTPSGLFKGVVSTDNNGGFASVRSKNFSPAVDLSGYSGIRVKVRGDGSRFKLVLRCSEDWDAVGYTSGFLTRRNQWHTVDIPFESFQPVFRAKTVSNGSPLNTKTIHSVQLLYSKFESDGLLNEAFTAGPFELAVAYIGGYLAPPYSPRLVHVGSAGVTRPDRPGLDLTKQPPAVRMNRELGGILTYKLKGEDLIRDSGIPFSIVRPCALTEEPAGADLAFDQGDNITGKISREEVARICVAALESPLAANKTFEVKSTVPFSEQYIGDPSAPPRDYSVYFEALKEGITGKEALVEA